VFSLGDDLVTVDTATDSLLSAIRVTSLASGLTTTTHTASGDTVTGASALLPSTAFAATASGASSLLRPLPTLEALTQALPRSVTGAIVAGHDSILSSPSSTHSINSNSSSAAVAASGDVKAGKRVFAPLPWQENGGIRDLTRPVRRADSTANSGNRSAPNNSNPNPNPSASASAGGVQWGVDALSSDDEADAAVETVLKQLAFGHAITEDNSDDTNQISSSVKSPPYSDLKSGGAGFVVDVTDSVPAPSTTTNNITLNSNAHTLCSPQSPSKPHAQSAAATGASSRLAALVSGWGHATAARGGAAGLAAHSQLLAALCDVGDNGGADGALRRLAGAAIVSGGAAQQVQSDDANMDNTIEDEVVAIGSKYADSDDIGGFAAALAAAAAVAHNDDENAILSGFAAVSDDNDDGDDNDNGYESDAKTLPPWESILAAAAAAKSPAADAAAATNGTAKNDGELLKVSEFSDNDDDDDDETYGKQVIPAEKKSDVDEDDLMAKLVSAGALILPPSMRSVKKSNDNKNTASKVGDSNTKAHSRIQANLGDNDNNAKIISPSSSTPAPANLTGAANVSAPASAAVGDAADDDDDDDDGYILSSSYLHSKYLNALPSDTTNLRDTATDVHTNTSRSRSNYNDSLVNDSKSADSALRQVSSYLSHALASSCALPPPSVLPYADVKPHYLRDDSDYNKVDTRGTESYAQQQPFASSSSLSSSSFASASSGSVNVAAAMDSTLAALAASDSALLASARRAVTTQSRFPQSQLQPQLQSESFGGAGVHGSVRGNAAGITIGDGDINADYDDYEKEAAFVRRALFASLGSDAPVMSTQRTDDARAAVAAAANAAASAAANAATAAITARSVYVPSASALASTAGGVRESSARASAFAGVVQPSAELLARYGDAFVAPTLAKARHGVATSQYSVDTARYSADTASFSDSNAAAVRCGSAVESCAGSQRYQSGSSYQTADDKLESTRADMLPAAFAAVFVSSPPPRSATQHTVSMNARDREQHFSDREQEWQQQRARLMSDDIASAHSRMIAKVLLPQTPSPQKYAHQYNMNNSNSSSSSSDDLRFSDSDRASMNSYAHCSAGSQYPAPAAAAAVYRRPTYANSLAANKFSLSRPDADVAHDFLAVSSQARATAAAADARYLPALSTREYDVSTRDGGYDVSPRSSASTLDAAARGALVYNTRASWGNHSSTVRGSATRATASHENSSSSNKSRCADVGAGQLIHDLNNTMTALRQTREMLSAAGYKTSLSSVHTATDSRPNFTGTDYNSGNNGRGSYGYGLSLARNRGNEGDHSLFL